MPCPELEQWLNTNILPMDKSLSHSLDFRPKPPTILDDPAVQEWLEKGKRIDGALCDVLSDLIIRQSSGFTTRGVIGHGVQVFFFRYSFCGGCHRAHPWV